MDPIASVPPRQVVPAVVAPGYPTLTFDVVNPVQSNFLGISAVNMAYLEWPEFGLTAQQKQTEYDRMRLSGLRMARTPVLTAWSNPTFPAGSFNYASADMGHLWTFVSECQARGIDVVFTTGWNFPGSVCDIDLHGTVPTCVPGASDETAWKQWVSQLLHEAINVRGFTNVKACMFFTEPNNAVADPSATDPKIPVGFTAGQYYAHLVQIAHDQIAADDASRTPILPRIQLIGSEEHNLTSTPAWLDYVKPLAPITVGAAHSYEDTPAFGPLGLTATNSPTAAAYLARWKAWLAGLPGLQVWSDEWNQLVNAGGDLDTTGYRATADAGMRLGRGLVLHAKAGVQAPFVWTARDEHFEGTGGYVQKFGIKDWPSSNNVKPSWYCATMLANLCGGGAGTKVFDVVGGESSTLYGVAVYVPSGDRWSTSAAGDWTVVVVNEGPVAQQVSVRLTASLGGRTMYRYTYSGEHVPVAASDPAYLLPWDQRYDNVTLSVPTNVAPGRSVCCYSTMIPAAGQVNLALSATATADSTGYGQPSNVCNGNRSNVKAPLNSWCKADDNPHALTLTWSGAVTVGRVALALVGTTPGVVWADYATTAAPAPLADYLLEYWTGTAWLQLASVTGNALINPSHTFAPVTTTKLRLTANSAAATAHVNHIGVYAS